MGPFFCMQGAGGESHWNLLRITARVTSRWKAASKPPLVPSHPRCPSAKQQREAAPLLTAGSLKVTHCKNTDESAVHTLRYGIEMRHVLLLFPSHTGKARPGSPSHTGTTGASKRQTAAEVQKQNAQEAAAAAAILVALPALMPFVPRMLREKVAASELHGTAGGAEAVSADKLCTRAF